MPASSPLPSGRHFEVFAASVDVRHAPSLEAKIIGTLTKGTRVKVADRENGMGQITNPIQGWVPFFDEKNKPMISRPDALGNVFLDHTKKETLSPNLAPLAKMLNRYLRIRDRRFFLKVYKDCFVGRSAVDWVMKNRYAKNRAHAAVLFDKLRQMGVIEHMRSKKRANVFVDGYAFYRVKNELIIAEELKSRMSEDSSATTERESGGASNRSLKKRDSAYSEASQTFERRLVPRKVFIALDSWVCKRDTNLIVRSRSPSLSREASKVLSCTTPRKNDKREKSRSRGISNIFNFGSKKFLEKSETKKNGSKKDLRKEGKYAAEAKRSNSSPRVVTHNL
mmetsp:Transcript_12537/g.18735  ORF Transcript_12537/g.18735 Transcript_12537/m.18735 type:complete len:337 (+) Transcript_12537:85-1095(+)